MAKSEPYRFGHLYRKGLKNGLLCSSCDSNLHFANFSSTYLTQACNMRIEVTRSWGREALNWRGHRLKYSPFSLFNVGPKKKQNDYWSQLQYSISNAECVGGGFNDFDRVLVNGKGQGERGSKIRWALWPACLLPLAQSFWLPLYGHGLGLYLFTTGRPRVLNLRYLAMPFERPCGVWLDCSTLGRNNDFSAEEVEGEN